MDCFAGYKHFWWSYPHDINNFELAVRYRDMLCYDYVKIKDTVHSNDSGVRIKYLIFAGVSAAEFQVLMNEE